MNNINKTNTLGTLTGTGVIKDKDGNVLQEFTIQTNVSEQQAKEFVTKQGAIDHGDHSYNNGS
jgi:hypothetical protein